MQFVSRFSSEPFRRFSSLANRPLERVTPKKVARPNPMLAETLLQDRLYSHKDLMFDNVFEAILDKGTGNPFTGKFIIMGDGIERICKVKLGEIVCNLVRLKDGVKYHAERGERGKYFKNALSEAEKQIKTKTILEADQKAFDEMTDTFIAAQEAQPNRFFGYNTN